MVRVFRTATKEDIDPIIKLIEQRIHWMDIHHLHQWNKTGYLEAYPKSYFAENIHYFLVAQEGEKMIAAVAVYQSDKRWEQDKTALYIHHLVSDPSVPNAGSDLLAFVERYAKQHGVNVLRLDSDIHNQKLAQYYEQHGYLPKGKCIEGQYIGIKREKTLLIPV